MSHWSDKIHWRKPKHTVTAKRRNWLLHQRAWHMRTGSYSDDHGVYSCFECGNEWRGYRRWAWWPVSVHFAWPKWPMGWFGMWGAESFEGVEQRLVTRYVRVGPIIVCIGPSRPKGEP